MAIFQLIARPPAGPNNANPVDGHTDFFAVCSRSGEEYFRAMKALYDTQIELKVDPITVTPFALLVTWHHKVFFVGAPGVPNYRDNPDLNRKMRELYNGYIEKMAKAGFPAYRTNPSAQDLLAAQFSFNNNALLKYQEALKDAVDPNGIISPGRYGVWPKRLRGNRA
jgi:(+)-pinoresinol hydroxylase